VLVSTSIPTPTVTPTPTDGLESPMGSFVMDSPAPVIFSPPASEVFSPVPIVMATPEFQIPSSTIITIAPDPPLPEVVPTFIRPLPTVRQKKPQGEAQFKLFQKDREERLRADREQEEERRQQEEAQRWQQEEAVRIQRELETMRQEQLKQQGLYTTGTGTTTTEVNDEELSELEDDDLVANGNEEEEACDTLICQFEKVTRVKNKWKLGLRDGVLTADGKDYLFLRAVGEGEW